MRSRWRAPLFAMVLASAATSPGLAQDEEEDFVEEESFGGDEEQAEEGDELEVPSEEAPPPAPVDEAAPPPADAAPESYVVQPGDTLWDLSERFLNNPWYWPKIWSYNPSLTNPNWIQPGTRIRFYPGAVEEPVEVEPEEPEEIEDDFVDVPLFQDRGVEPPKVGDVNAETGRREYFITDEQLEEAGRIRNSPEEKEMLSVFDSTYFDLEQTPDPGQMLQVFEVQRDLRHPVTGENLGKVVHTLGVARVDRVDEGKQHLGTIVASWDPIYRGAYLGALQEIDVSSVTPVTNDKDVRGYVVDTARYPTRNIGQNHIIFIDRGQDAGVQVGNTFVVVRAGDPFTGDYSSKLSDEDIGKLMVIDVGERGSTAVVIESSREIVAGDRIHMREGE